MLEIAYGDPVTAYRMGWYPGAEHAGPRRIRFKTADYFDVLRMLNFVDMTRRNPVVSMRFIALVALLFSLVAMSIDSMLPALGQIASDLARLFRQQPPACADRLLRRPDGRAIDLRPDLRHHRPQACHRMPGSASSWSAA